jgi:hypothetical protein
MHNSVFIRLLRIATSSSVALLLLLLLLEEAFLPTGVLRPDDDGAGDGVAPRGEAWCKMGVGGRCCPAKIDGETTRRQ